MPVCRPAITDIHHCAPLFCRANGDSKPLHVAADPVGPSDRVDSAKITVSAGLPTDVADRPPPVQYQMPYFSGDDQSGTNPAEGSTFVR